MSTLRLAVVCALIGALGTACKRDRPAELGPSATASPAAQPAPTEPLATGRLLAAPTAELAALAPTAAAPPKDDATDDVTDDATDDTADCGDAHGAEHRAACGGDRGDAHGAEHRAACGADKGKPSATCGQPGSGCNQWDEEAAEVTRRAKPDDAVWKTWEVEGMHCGGCERRVIAKVGGVAGVVAVKANAGTGRVSVAVSPGDESRFGAARERIAALGYSVGGETPSL